jgi:hypothetical protein
MRIPWFSHNIVIKIEDKQITAYKNMLERDSYYLHEECRLLSPVAIVWALRG